jgi:hypothetical protein
MAVSTEGGVLMGAPDWLAAEMPPGYRTRLLEIERLTSELRVMDGVGRILWETGEPLRGGIVALFAALKCEVAAQPEAGPVTVKLADTRRLLVVVSQTASPLQRIDEELTRGFQAVQAAEAGDRVVLVGNPDPMLPPAQRPQPALPDALSMLERMGINVATGPILFALWRLSHEDQAKARKALDRLHEQDGGLFSLAPVDAPRTQEAAASRSRSW